MTLNLGMGCGARAKSRTCLLLTVASYLTLCLSFLVYIMGVRITLTLYLWQRLHEAIERKHWQQCLPARLT